MATFLVTFGRRTSADSFHATRVFVHVYNRFSHFQFKRERFHQELIPDNGYFFGKRVAIVGRVGSPRYFCLPN